MAWTILGWEVPEDPDWQDVGQYQEQEGQIMDFRFQICDFRLHSINEKWHTDERGLLWILTDRSVSIRLNQ